MVTLSDLPDIRGRFMRPGGQMFCEAEHKSDKRKVGVPLLEKKTNIYWLFILPGCLFLAFFMLIPLFSLLFKTFVDDGVAFPQKFYGILFNHDFRLPPFLQSSYRNSINGLRGFIRGCEIRRLISG